MALRNGLEKYGGLPGLILELKTEINQIDGSKEGNQFTAIKIDALKASKKIKYLQKVKL